VCRTGHGPPASPFELSLNRFPQRLVSCLLMACFATGCAKTYAPLPPPPEISPVLPPSADPTNAAENRLWSGATAAQNEGRHDLAIRTFKRLINAYPKSPHLAEGRWRLGQSFEEIGDIPAAVSEYRVLMEMEPLLLPNDSFQALATQRLEALRLEGVLPENIVSGHTALSVSALGILSLSPVDAWLQQVRESGVTALVLDVSCDAVCSGNVRVPPSEDQAPVGPRPGVLFATVHAPVVQPLMNSLVPEAHRVGLSVFAAIDLVRAPWLENRTDWQTSVLNPREHAVRPWGYLDVLNPSVNTHFAALLSDLAQTQLDGVLFRTRTRNSFAYEMSEIALSGFQSQYHETAADVTRALENSAASVQNESPPAQPGETPAQEPSADTLWHWVGWRAQQELDALAQLRRTLQQTRHGLRVILEMHSEAASDPLATLVNYGEDVAEASRRGFDILLNGTARAADLQQVADLVKQAEVKALRKPVKGQPSGQQLWILNRGQGFGGRLDPGRLAQYADRVRIREGVNVLLVPDRGETVP